MLSGNPSRLYILVTLHPPGNVLYLDQGDCSVMKDEKHVVKECFTKAENPLI